jgi:hypothetical protein
MNLYPLNMLSCRLISHLHDHKLSASCVIRQSVLAQLQYNCLASSVLNTLSPASSVKMWELFPLRPQPIPISNHPHVTCLLIIQSHVKPVGIKPWSGHMYSSKSCVPPMVIDKLVGRKPWFTMTTTRWPEAMLRDKNLPSYDLYSSKLWSGIFSKLWSKMNITRHLTCLAWSLHQWWQPPTI